MSSNLRVIAGGRIVVINERLLDRQQCWFNVRDIKNCHELKLIIYSIMDETDGKAELKSLGNDLFVIESELQRLWGFPINPNYHRFWEYPKCTCPTFDNIDSYPYRSYISADCPLHGD